MTPTQPRLQQASSKCSKGARLVVIKALIRDLETGDRNEANSSERLAGTGGTVFTIPWVSSTQQHHPVPPPKGAPCPLAWIEKHRTVGR